MSNIDRQRSRAVELLEERGYCWDGLEWNLSAQTPEITWEADRMYALLMHRAAVLEASIAHANSANVPELAMIGDALDAYELKRWPLGKIEGGKG
ncbi:MAG: hypothetical protein EKK41_21115 [Hyphomicrobiales bacterium]|nr:MAG: hypothetical protein EKK41_21115 [Hyphomicrobiales bacterium]